MKMKKIDIVIGLLLCSVMIRAQESKLLEDYRNKVLQYNQDVMASEQNILLNKELEKSARADYKPKLSAGANFNYTGNPMELNLNLPSLENPVSFKASDTKYGASLSLIQPIYMGGKIREASKMAEEESRLAMYQSATVKSNVCYEADLRYWNTVALGEMADITKQYYSAVEELVKVVRERVEVELVDRNDLLMAEVKLNEASYQRMQAQNNYEVARLSLNSFVGVSFDSEMRIDTAIPNILSVKELVVYMENAPSNRAELKMAESKIFIQESALKLNDSKFLPQFYIGIDGSYSSPGYNFKSDLDPNYAVYAKLSVPLFEWGKRKNEKQASRYRVGMAKENYGKINDNINLEINSAYYSYSQAAERVTLTESSLKKAKENENMAFDRYKEGKISIAEVLDAQIYYQTAEINHVQSRLNAQAARSEFIRALGIYQF